MPKEKRVEDMPDLHGISPKFNELSKEEKISLISHLAEELKRQHSVNPQEIFLAKEFAVPIGVFGNDTLSSLEAIVKYLKEESKLKFSKIAKLLNRSSKTMWTTYHNAAKKMPSSFGSISRDILIPASAFANRSFSTLECLVGFIKDLGYSNHEVALMLHLDDRTIWTVYDRVKKKHGVKA